MAMPRLRWIDGLILPVASAVMMAAWFEPWVRWVARAAGRLPSGPVPSALAMVAVILISGAATRLALRSATPHVRRWVLACGAGLIVGVAWLNYGAHFPWPYLRDLLDWRNSVSPELIVLLTSAVLWWRGVILGRTRSVTDEGVERGFFNGIIALALLVFINNFNLFVPPPDMLAAVLTFFGTALSALTLISLENARRQQHDVTGPWLRLNRPWLLTIVGVVAVILLGALSLTGLISPDALRQLIADLRPLFDAVIEVLRAALMAIVTVLAWLVQPLLPIIQAIARLILTAVMGFLQVIGRIGDEFQRLQAEEEIDSFLNSPEFVTISRSVLVAIALVILALLAVWALRKWGLLPRRKLDETRESIMSRQLLLSQLRDLLNRWRATTPSGPPPLYLPLAGDEARAVVRRAYQQWLEWARINDRARQPRQTPTQYAGVIERDVPEVGAAFRPLTESYERARYGAEPLTPDDVRAAQDSLVTLQTVSVIKSSSSEQ